MILIFALVITGGSLYCFSEVEQTVSLSGGEREEKTAARITVYVCGAVNKPGVLELDDGARVADAVKLCGGVLPGADVQKVNMAQMLKDGTQVTVPEKAVTSAASVGDAKVSVTRKGSEVADPININTADLAELDRLPGVGPALAEAIIEYRNVEGMFQSPEDLMKVKGIGEAKFNKMKSKVTL